jgi:hypothetical protein
MDIYDEPHPKIHNHTQGHNSNIHDMQLHDTQLQHIHYLIDKKKKMLLKKQHYLSKVQKQNTFLKGVHEDYVKYNDYIIKEKQDQLKAFEMLNQYIDSLTKTGKLTTNNIKDAEYEQHKIMHEIRSIQSNLDKMIDKMNGQDTITDK